MSDIKQKIKEKWLRSSGISTIDFIMQEIDLAIKERDKEIAEMMWQVREDWRNDGQIQALPTADYLINLITNSKE